MAVNLRALGNKGGPGALKRPTQNAKVWAIPNFGEAESLNKACPRITTRAGGLRAIWCAGG